MQKLKFSWRRTLIITSIGLLGFIITSGVLFYFLIPQPTNFTYLQWALLIIGTISFSSAIQYKLIMLAKKA